jgi:hypothetical protein
MLYDQLIDHMTRVPAIISQIQTRHPYELRHAMLLVGGNLLLFELKIGSERERMEQHFSDKLFKFFSNDATVKDIS